MHGKIDSAKGAFSEHLADAIELRRGLEGFLQLQEAVFYLLGQTALVTSAGREILGSHVRLESLTFERMANSSNNCRSRLVNKLLRRRLVQEAA